MWDCKWALIGFYFFLDESIQYLELEFLQNDLPRLLKDVDLNARWKMWFQWQVVCLHIMHELWEITWMQHSRIDELVVKVQFSTPLVRFALPRFFSIGIFQRRCLLQTTNDKSQYNKLLAEEFLHIQWRILKDEFDFLLSRTAISSSYSKEKRLQSCLK